MSNNPDARVIQCPDCGGDGYIDDPSACGDPECCGSWAFECAMCEGAGEIEVGPLDRMPL